MYLAVCTRPDIAHAVSYLSQYNDCHDSSHWSAAKRVLRYLKGTRNVGLSFKKTTKSLIGYVDANWANCLDDRKSYTGFVFMMAGNPISWESRKQPTTALSSTEAEYMALSEATKEAVYLQSFLLELGMTAVQKVKLFSDNCGAIKLADNPIHHNRSKHIDVRHHFVRGALQSGRIEVVYKPTEHMAADVLTKGLSRSKHRKCTELLGLRFDDVEINYCPSLEGKC